MVNGWTGTLILTLDFIILCLFSGSKLGSPVTSGVTRRQSCVYFVDCKGISSTHTLYLGTKKYRSFTKSRTCGGPPSSAKYVTQVRPPSVPECPPTHSISTCFYSSKINSSHISEIWYPLMQEYNCNVLYNVSNYSTCPFLHCVRDQARVHIYNIWFTSKHTLNIFFYEVLVHLSCLPGHI